MATVPNPCDRPGLEYTARRLDHRGRARTNPKSILPGLSGPHQSCAVDRTIAVVDRDAAEFPSPTTSQTPSPSNPSASLGKARPSRRVKPAPLAGSSWGRVPRPIPRETLTKTPGPSVVDRIRTATPDPGRAHPTFRQDESPSANPSKVSASRGLVQNPFLAVSDLVQNIRQLLRVQQRLGSFGKIFPATTPVGRRLFPAIKRIRENRQVRAAWRILSPGDNPIERESPAAIGEAEADAVPGTGSTEIRRGPGPA